MVKQSLSFLPAGDAAILRGQLLELAPVKDCYDKDGRIHVMTENTDDALKAIFTGGLAVRNVRIHQGSLDEAFEQLTRNHEEDMKR
ncbi:hypothetical protein D3C75_1202160 [compost metagenome]